MCVWNNLDFSCTTMGFKLAFYTQAPEEDTSSVTVKKEKEKKINQKLGITGRGKNKISLCSCVSYVLPASYMLDMAWAPFQKQKNRGKDA